MDAKKGPLLALIVLALVLFCVQFHAQDVWWDSAVYLGMGKWLWSMGESGLVEPARPLVLPILIGFFWKVGLDAVLFGKILALLFSVGLVVATYYLGLELWGRRAGFLAGLFATLSQTMLAFSTHSLTEIPSALFLALGVLLLLRERLLLAGVFFGLSAMTRFFSVIAIALAVLGFLYLRRDLKGAFRICLGALIPALPYLVFAQMAYGGFLVPMHQQMVLTLETGAVYSEPWRYYALGLLSENVFFAALVLAPFAMRREGRWVVLIPALCALLVYSLFAHKEMRLLLPFMPLLWASAGAATKELIDMATMRFRNARFAIGLVFALWLLFAVSSAAIPFSQEENAILSQIQQKTKLLPSPILVSSPLYALHSDARAHLLYYPWLESGADIAVYNPCDLLGNHEEYYVRLENGLSFVSVMQKEEHFSLHGCEAGIYYATS